jgi:hypothetical protein
VYNHHWYAGISIFIIIIITAKWDFIELFSGSLGGFWGSSGSLDHFVGLLCDFVRRGHQVHEIFDYVNPWNE